MLDNAMADKALDAEKICQLKNLLENEIERKAIKEQTIDWHEERIEQLLHRNDDLIDENEELKKASNLIIERHEHLIEQLTEEEDDDYHGSTKHRYSYGQNKAFMAFAIANNIPEPTLHKFYEALLKLEDGFDPDAPSAAETNYNNLLENLEHLVNCHAVSNSLTVKLNENKGE
jgi:hypothetical protein